MSKISERWHFYIIIIIIIIDGLLKKFRWVKDFQIFRVNNTKKSYK